MEEGAQRESQCEGGERCDGDQPGGVFECEPGDGGEEEQAKRESCGESGAGICGLEREQGPGSPDSGDACRNGDGEAKECDEDGFGQRGGTRQLGK